MLRVTLPNGKSVKRTDGILVEDGGLISSAFVDKIGMSEGFPYVSAVILDTTRNSLDTGQNNPTVKPAPEAVGYRHVSTPDHIPGRRFCLLDEQEEIELRRHHNAIAEPQLKGTGEVTQPVDDAGQANTSQESAQSLTERQLRRQARKNK
jgi:hypothetical protein